MQQLANTECRILGNAIILSPITPPDMDSASQWSKQLLKLLQLQYIEGEISADLFVAAAKFHTMTDGQNEDEMVFLKINYNINDVWFELAQHKEKTFFNLFDRIEAKLISIR